MKKETEAHEKRNAQLSSPFSFLLNLKISCCLNIDNDYRYLNSKRVYIMTIRKKSSIMDRVYQEKVGH